MSVSAETYIVISLMFAVFAAVAAVGTSVVLGAGFERLRAGFEIIKNQSGFFADAIYKLDLKTQALDQETAKLKTGLQENTDRVMRVEKQTQFIGDEMSAFQQRILNGTPTQSVAPLPDLKNFDGMHPVHTIVQHQAKPAPVMEVSVPAPMMDDETTDDLPMVEPEQMSEQTSDGLTTLLSRYFLGEGSGGGRDVVYH